MIRGFYSGVSGAIAHTNAVDVIANNIANVNTSGYKSQKAEFTDLVYTNMMTPDGDAPQNLKQGSGARVSGTSLNLSQGILQVTDRSLDVALSGEGFFAVMDNQGNISYTRQGAFQLSAMADGSFALATANGDLVLNSEMQPIQIAAGQDIHFAAPGNGTEGSIELGIVSFANPYALEKLGNSKYAANDSTGPAALYENASIRQGCLENSAVDLTGEMTDLIMAQWGFQVNARVIQTADDLEQTVNNIR